MKGILFIHVFSASVLFASGLVTAIVMLCAVFGSDRDNLVRSCRRVVLSDWVLTVPSGTVQIITGFVLGWQMGLLHQIWFFCVLVLFAIAGICWVPVVGLQIRMSRIAETEMREGLELSSSFMKCFWLWFWLGWPAFGALVAVFWLMVVQPDFGIW